FAADTAGEGGNGLARQRQPAAGWSLIRVTGDFVRQSAPSAFFRPPQGFPTGRQQNWLLP
ncbi:hypothetical protein, partial [Mycobacterium avium]|uniref:hypothetical protein n=1 Tax=Mycobacterium avium TaxID=1764 RepID=UPI00289F61C3